MGNCAISGGPFVFPGQYAVVEGVDKLFPVDVYIPGCPPRPEALIEGILKLEEKLTGKRRWPRVKAGVKAGHDGDGSDRNEPARLHWPRLLPGGGLRATAPVAGRRIAPAAAAADAGTLRPISRAPIPFAGVDYAGQRLSLRGDRRPDQVVAAAEHARRSRASPWTPSPAWTGWPRARWKWSTITSTRRTALRVRRPHPHPARQPGAADHLARCFPAPTGMSARRMTSSASASSGIRT